MIIAKLINKALISIH